MIHRTVMGLQINTLLRRSIQRHPVADNLWLDLAGEGAVVAASSVDFVDWAAEVIRPDVVAVLDDSRLLGVDAVVLLRVLLFFDQLVVHEEVGRGSICLLALVGFSLQCMPAAFGGEG